MKQILIAVLLSTLLGPGLGQLYNREFKKGTILIVLGLLMFGGFVTWLIMVLKPHLQGIDPNSLTPELLQQIQSEVLSLHKSSISAFKWAFGFLWAYSMVDAFLGARARVKTLSAPKA